MTCASAPENGDVLIRPGVPDAEPHYVLRSVPGPDQFGYATLEDAVSIARAYAAHAKVCVWLADRANGFTLLDAFRESAGHIPQQAEPVTTTPESRT